jgi:outer membrane protein insertion porin family
MSHGRILQVSSNLDAPLRLSSIRITGTKHTRPSFLGRIVSPYLSSPTVSATSQGADALPSPETLRDVLRKTRDITDHLNKLDIFSEVEAGLESSTDVFAGPEDVDLVLKVKEASRYFLRTATDVGDGEGNAVRSILSRLSELETMLT